MNFLILFGILTAKTVYGSWEAEVPNNAFNRSFFEAVLDPELCHEQIRIIRGNSLLSILFADAGIRTPRGILQGNTVDLGNYHQCLGINMQLPDSELQGKYCMINVPLNQTLGLPQWPPPLALRNFDTDFLRLDNETIRRYEEISNVQLALKAMAGKIDDRSTSNNPLAAFTFRLAVCIPKPCSTQQAITSLLFNITEIGFRYTDDFCRLPDDKPWVPGDYVVIAVFGIIGLVTLISTSYDIWHTFYSKRDPKTASAMGKSFSVFTNGRRLMNFASGAGILECLDGIRSISIAWIILGHFFTIQSFWSNPIDGHTWQRTYSSLWITSGHLAVDTFFTLSGLLVVYTTAGKLSGIQLLKNIHLFYLNRLLRMFPLLAIAVLLEATYMFRLTDGPVWNTIANQVESCRANWWSTLLHIQNYATPRAMCMVHSWYLAVDTQMHILSPIVLVFALNGNRKIAWTGLLAGLSAIMISSTTYNFIRDFPTQMGAPGREHESADYLFNYYLNTLTRGPPFVVGMVFGYLLHLCRDSRVKMSKLQVLIVWVILAATSMFVIYTNYPIRQLDWSNHTLDNVFNSFIRPLWGLLLCCMIFVCVNGYGGPLNWFLSLRIWKLPARISYAMYLFHYMLMLTIQNSAVAPIRFSLPSIIFQFLAYYSLCFMVSFVLTLVVDSPFSTIFKRLLGPGPKKPQQKDIVGTEITLQNEKQV